MPDNGKSFICYLSQREDPLIFNEQVFIYTIIYIDTVMLTMQAL